MKLYCLTSDLHSEVIVEASGEKFISDIEKVCGRRFEYRTDYSDYDSSDSVIYVRTGGTEGIFKSIFCRSGRLEIPGEAPVLLLTSGQSNSLAASMEILSYLNKNGRAGRIIHGSPEQIALSFSAAGRCGSSGKLRTLDGSLTLKGKRYGVVGKPSDWLISSDVDYAKAKTTLGCELVDIPVEELVGLVRGGSYEAPAGLLPLGPQKYGKTISDSDFRTAVNIYGALKELIGRYSLDGFSLRCFDLLTAVSNTGCLALALLNSEGYIATCEGDVPTMLSMALAREMTGRSGFQVNLSRIVGDRLLFAHCTIPLNMVNSYCYDTHFESGIGVAVHGELPENIPARLFKLGADLEHYVDEEVVLLGNQYENNLCRTQIWVQAPGLDKYLLVEPLGNHHVLVF